MRVTLEWDGMSLTTTAAGGCDSPTLSLDDITAFRPPNHQWARTKHARPHASYTSRPPFTQSHPSLTSNAPVKTTYQYQAARMHSQLPVVAEDVDPRS